MHTYFENEKQAKQEVEWMSSHTNIREFILTAVTKTGVDPLDDEVPF